MSVLDNFDEDSLQYLFDFDQEAEDRAAIEELMGSDEVWEIDPTGEDDDE